MLNFHVLEVCCFRAVWDSMFCFQFFCGHVHDGAVTCSEAGVVHAIMISFCLFHVSEMCDFMLFGRNVFLF
jgi:hypothetical protein